MWVGQSSFSSYGCSRNIVLWGFETFANHLFRTSGNLPLSLVKPTRTCLSTGSKREWVPIDLKMPNFTAETCMFTAWYKKWFWSISLILPFVTTVRGVIFCITHPFKLYYALNFCIIKGVATWVTGGLPLLSPLSHLVGVVSATSSAHLPPFCPFLIIFDALPRWRRMAPPTLSFKNPLQKPTGDVTDNTSIFLQSMLGILKSGPFLQSWARTLIKHTWAC